MVIFKDKSYQKLVILRVKLVRINKEQVILNDRLIILKDKSVITLSKEGAVCLFLRIKS